MDLRSIPIDRLEQQKNGFESRFTSKQRSGQPCICREYDNLSGPERQERLIEFLGLFARRDAIRDNQFEFATDSDSEPSSSDNENE